uniref:Uncharacterized protein n=1 Tax=Molossus molossus TaxID=27622 RepID=A0A7J8DC15_MOLMO|nr:hypothetical protein HJG59_009330 [Molossus molossus]
MMKNQREENLPQQPPRASVNFYTTSQVTYSPGARNAPQKTKYLAFSKKEGRKNEIRRRTRSTSSEEQAQPWVHLPRDYHTGLANGNLPPVNHMDWKQQHPGGLVGNATRAANTIYEDLPKSPSIENSQDDIPVFFHKKERQWVVVGG